MVTDASQIRDEQWNKIAPLLPDLQPSPRGGRKPAGNRVCFEGLLWILRSGAR